MTVVDDKKAMTTTYDGRMKIRTIEPKKQKRTVRTLRILREIKNRKQTGKVREKTFDS